MRAEPTTDAGAVPANWKCPCGKVNMDTDTCSSCGVKYSSRPPRPPAELERPEARGRVQYLALDQVQESKTNPRRTVKDAHFADLVDSVRKHGVLQPILVRPMHGRTLADPYELVAGHRRLAAAREAALDAVPAFIRELSDQAALEIQVIENLQRSDLHALEEAQGYQRLLSMKYDVARIAERIGRSAKYVYDRVKLLQLIPKAQELFLADRFTPGHAVILARLKPKDQERAIDVSGHNSEYGGTRSPLFVEEHTLFDPEEEVLSKKRKQDPLEGYKTRSVRELQAWVDEEVRFDPSASDLPDLFPETHATLAAATAEQDKIILITREYVTPAPARGGPRIYTRQSWMRADGQPERGRFGAEGKLAKICENSITGVIAIGQGRGQAFKVCIAKEKCSTHWAAWQKERAQRQRSAGSGSSAKSAGPSKRELEERAGQEADRKRWEGAKPEVLKIIAATIRKESATATGRLAKVILEAEDIYTSPHEDKQIQKLLPVGRTAEDLVRYLAMRVIWCGLDYSDYPEDALKGLGLKLEEILDKVAPVQTSAQPEKQAKKADRAKGKKAKKKGGR